MNPYIGQIVMTAIDFAPSDYWICDGSLKQIQDNTALFSVIGTIFGGDGRTPFKIPDYRNRMSVGAGQGPGLENIYLGQKSGSNSVTLNVGNLPYHNHPFLKDDNGNNTGMNYNEEENSGEGNTVSDLGVNDSAAAGTIGLSQKVTQNTGGNAPIDITNPNQYILFLLAHEGRFPT